MPSVQEDQLGQAIRDLEPVLASFFLSFAVIGLFWLAHHRNFAWIRRVDTPILMMNLLLLSLVASMPFPSDLLGRYPSSVPAVVLYAAAGHPMHRTPHATPQPTRTAA